MLFLRCVATYVHKKRETAAAARGPYGRKVVIQANRSGFLYVLDAKDGKLIAVNAFGKVN